MSWTHRMLAALVPAPRDSWIRAHAGELAQITGRWNRLRWRLGLLAIASWALASQLRHDPRSFLGGVLLKTLLVGIALLNVTVGVALVAIYLVETNAWPMLFLGIALVGQSAYTLALIRHKHATRRTLGRRVHLAASTGAIAAGLTALAAGTLANTNPATGDPEYGPMTIGLLIAAHGLTSLLALANRHTPHAQDT